MPEAIEHWLHCRFKRGWSDDEAACGGHIGEELNCPIQCEFPYVPGILYRLQTFPLARERTTAPSKSASSHESPAVTYTVSIQFSQYSRSIGVAEIIERESALVLAPSLELPSIPDVRAFPERWGAAESGGAARQSMAAPCIYPFAFLHYYFPCVGRTM
jgi:hypothetical protein